MPSFASRRPPASTVARPPENRELTETLAALRANEQKFALATEPYYVEQLIFERAALRSHCRLLLKTMRRGAEARV